MSNYYDWQSVVSNSDEKTFVIGARRNGKWIEQLCNHSYFVRTYLLYKNNPDKEYRNPLGPFFDGFFNVVAINYALEISLSCLLYSISKLGALTLPEETLDYSYISKAQRVSWFVRKYLFFKEHASWCWFHPEILCPFYLGKRSDLDCAYCDWS